MDEFYLDVETKIIFRATKGEPWLGAETVDLYRNGNNNGFITLKSFLKRVEIGTFIKCTRLMEALYGR